MKYIIGNWKAHKNLTRAQQWIRQFLKNDFSEIQEKAQVIICPPFPFIPVLKSMISAYSFISIGSQDVSRYEEGNYTGEVPIQSLKGLVTHVIIGHSERRKLFNESVEELGKKAALTKNNGIEPIFCIRGKNDPVPKNICFVAFEPVESISSGTGEGNNMSVEKVIAVKQSLNLASGSCFIYGGSVNEKNASAYLQNAEIDGVLVGGASLDYDRFYSIIEAV